MSRSAARHGAEAFQSVEADGPDLVYDRCQDLRVLDEIDESGGGGQGGVSSGGDQGGHQLGADQPEQGPACFQPLAHGCGLEGHEGTDGAVVGADVVDESCDFFQQLGRVCAPGQSGEEGAHGVARELGQGDRGVGVDGSGYGEGAALERAGNRALHAEVGADFERGVPEQSAHEEVPCARGVESFGGRSKHSREQLGLGVGVDERELGAHHLGAEDRANAGVAAALEAGGIAAEAEVAEPGDEPRELGQRTTDGGRKARGGRAGWGGGWGLGEHLGDRLADAAAANRTAAGGCPERIDGTASVGNGGLEGGAVDAQAPADDRIRGLECGFTSGAAQGSALLDAQRLAVEGERVQAGEVFVLTGVFEAYDAVGLVEPNHRAGGDFHFFVDHRADDGEGVRAAWAAQRRDLPTVRQVVERLDAGLSIHKHRALVQGSSARQLVAADE